MQNEKPGGWEKTRKKGRTELQKALEMGQGKPDRLRKGKRAQGKRGKWFLALKHEGSLQNEEGRPHQKGRAASVAKILSSAFFKKEGFSRQEPDW